MLVISPYIFINGVDQPLKNGEDSQWLQLNSQFSVPKSVPPDVPSSRQRAERIVSPRGFRWKPTASSPRWEGCPALSATARCPFGDGYGGWRYMEMGQLEWWDIKMDIQMIFRSISLNHIHWNIPRSLRTLHWLIMELPIKKLPYSGESIPHFETQPLGVGPKDATVSHVSIPE